MSASLHELKGEPRVLAQMDTYILQKIPKPMYMGTCTPAAGRNGQHELPFTVFFFFLQRQK